MVGVALEAAKELEGRGVSCEVINLRSLRPLDRECIVESVKKTHFVMSVEGGWPQCGIGSEIAACIMESEPFPPLSTLSLCCVEHGVFFFRACGE